MMRQCSKCSLEKPADAFYKGQAECKVCFGLRMKAYEQSHPEVVALKSERYNKTPKAKARRLRYRASENGKLQRRAQQQRRRASGRLNGKDLQRVFECHGRVCMYCGKPADEVDHFKPLAMGGTHMSENLVPACKSCNSSKRDQNPFAWMLAKGINFEVR